MVFILSLLLCLLLFTACNTTKFVPQNQYLLNKAYVKVEDTKDVASSELRTYLQQKPNTEILGFWKLQLGIYNTASLDTTKWTSRNARKIGEAPVVFSPSLTNLSAQQLKLAMQNRGYFNADVDTTMEIKKRKVNLTYHITAEEPYTIRHYYVDFAHTELRQIAQNMRYAFLQEGMQFNADMLNQERQRVASEMRRHGCYYFDQDYIKFVADSTVGNHQVDVTIGLQDYVKNLPAEEQEKLFRHYRISHVCFHMDYDIDRIPEGVELNHSVYDGYEFTWQGDKLLRENVLIRSCPILPGDEFNESLLERAYSNLNRLAPIKYVEINFDPISANELDCHIVLSRSKLNSVSVEAEGT